MTPKLSRDKKPSAQITKREGETRGEGERGRPGEFSPGFSPSPCLPVSLSPCFLVSLSPTLLLSNRRSQRDFAFGVIVNVIGYHSRRVRNPFVAGEVIHVHDVRPAVALDNVQAVQAKAACFADAL